MLGGVCGADVLQHHVASAAGRDACGCGRAISSYLVEIEVIAGRFGSGAWRRAAASEPPPQLPGERRAPAGRAELVGELGAVEGAGQAHHVGHPCGRSGQNFKAHTGSAPPWLCPTTAIRPPARREALRIATTTYCAATSRIAQPVVGRLEPGGWRSRRPARPARRPRPRSPPFFSPVPWTRSTTPRAARHRALLGRGRRAAEQAGGHGQRRAGGSGGRARGGWAGSRQPAAGDEHIRASRPAGARRVMTSPTESLPEGYAVVGAVRRSAAAGPLSRNRGIRRPRGRSPPPTAGR